MYELLGELKPLHLMQLPRLQNAAALNGWLAEMERLKEWFEETFAVEITLARLQDAIRLLNDERRSLKGLMEVCSLKPSPLSGMDLLKVLHNTGFSIDRRETIELSTNSRRNCKRWPTQASLLLARRPRASC